MFHKPVYLDNNATTAMDPRVFEAMTPYFMEHYGNAASTTHVYGWEAKEAVDNAREMIAGLINAHPKEIIFTSGATESVNLALKGAFEKNSSKGNHIITCVTEHKAVLDTCKHLENLGAEITYLPVKSDGIIDLSVLELEIRQSTILIAIMFANNETGVIQPVRHISAIARKHNVLFFCDGTQAVGKIPVDIQKEGIDLMAFSAHKNYGPKGSGALFVKRKPTTAQLTAQMDGGGHERGFRSGTLNVPGIIGLGAASEICSKEMAANQVQVKSLRDKLEKALLKLPGSFLNGNTEHRLPNVSNIAFDNIDGHGMILALSKYIAISSGSACTSVSQEPSFVLKAMGLSDELARSSFRFSLGRFTTPAEIDFTIEKLSSILLHFRESAKK
ncbi:MAG: cysteine desulfurase family protein [Chitinophagaceae bacterium]